MGTTGIICEYNPLHAGHKKQLQAVRALREADEGIVCLMSGSFVQRGAPALLDKSLRAKAAILCGADLVLELPVGYALSSAEGFASGGVRILSGFCDSLCFGAETAEPEVLLGTARSLLSQDFPGALRQELDKGLSFPAARQQALEHMGCDGSVLTAPNNILAVEYCKAILSQNASMVPLPIHRAGCYHDTVPNLSDPSATSVRQAALTGRDWLRYVPPEAKEVFSGASLHQLAAGERAILARLRCMTEQDYQALPYGSEGLWRKFMHAAREKSTVEEILTAVKSKRYTRTRLDRMLMCAFLGLTAQDLHTSAPYTRVLALNDRGRTILKEARKTGVFLNAGEASDHPYWDLEQRIGSLYGLFATGSPEVPHTEASRRVSYHTDSHPAG